MNGNRKGDPSTGPKSGKGRAWTIIKSTLLSTAIVSTYVIILAGISTFASPEKFVTTEEISQQYTVIESSGGTYFGSVIESIYSGEGEFKYLAGGVYTGEFADSQRSGVGTYTWENGDSFNGTWKNDNIENGTYTFSSGAIFRGQFEGNSFYNGEFDLGPNCAENGLVYFRAQIVNMQIVSLDFKMEDGTTYKGAIQGTATISYSSGNSYTGKVMDGQRHGEGTFYWKEDSEIVASYKGNWVDGVMSGSGTYYYTKENFPYIIGIFSDGKPEGTATYIKNATDSFTTTWANGKCTKVSTS